MTWKQIFLNKENLNKNESIINSQVALCIKHGPKHKISIQKKKKFYPLLPPIYMLFLSIHLYSVSIKNCLFQVIALYFFIYETCSVFQQHFFLWQNSVDINIGNVIAETITNQPTFYTRTALISNKKIYLRKREEKKKIHFNIFHGRASPPSSSNTSYTLLYYTNNVFRVKSELRVYIHIPENLCKCLGVYLI